MTKADERLKEEMKESISRTEKKIKKAFTPHLMRWDMLMEKKKLKELKKSVGKREKELAIIGLRWVKQEWLLFFTKTEVLGQTQQEP